jgi:hypothetical protein
MWFRIEIDRVVRPFFKEGEDRIGDAANQIDLETNKLLTEAKDEDEAVTAWQLRDYEQSFLEKRRDLLAAAVLHYVYESMKLRLREIARYFKTSHPAKPPYNGKSELHRIKEEFSARFKVDFDKFPSNFEKIEELALARNAAIHESFEEYRQTVVSPRFIKNGQFYVEEENLEELISDVDGFVQWVVDEMKPIRKSAAGAKDSKT